MLELIIFLLLSLVIIPLGIRAFRIFIIDKDLTLLEESFIGFGLGSGLLALLILFIGMVGLLYKQVIIGFLLLLSIVLIRDMKYYLMRVVVGIKGLRMKKLAVSERLLIALIAFIWLFTLVGALTPLLGTDAASYHMRDAKIFIEQHKIAHIPYTRESMWPFLIQMLFTLGLFLKGPIVGKLFNFAFGFMSIVVVYSLCRKHLSRIISLTAAAIFASIPAIFTSANYAYTDLAVVFYTLAAFYAFYRWLDNRELSWFYISGIFCGFLLGIKITSATVPVIIVILYFYDCIRTRNINKRSLFGLLYFMLMVFLICGIWYIRSWVVLGNPIFPFAAYIFGSGYPEEVLQYHLIAGLGLSPLAYLRMLWPLTISPVTFGGESIGPVFLIFLPMLIFIKKPARFIHYMMLITLALYTAWFFTFQYTRFLMPTLCFFAILAAYAYSEICRRDRIIFKAATTALILTFSYSAALAAYHNLANIPVAFGLESRHDYLIRRERSYKMAQYINNNLPKTAKIFVLEDPHLFYIDLEVVDASCFKMDTRYGKFIRNANEFAGYLRNEGFDYALGLEYLNPNAKGVSQKGTIEILGKRNIELVKEVDFEYRDERYRYKLWKIKNT